MVRKNGRSETDMFVSFARQRHTKPPNGCRRLIAFRPQTIEKIGAEGGIRTHTTLRSTDFKSDESGIT
jgi:hypothetical protein